ncbi:RHS repeat-associated core domain-containing protein [Kitasatospora sp. NBC_01302]|uniref:RHS repeat-associated core domain-containing protein n=1 Tax=Kitasatospora sp. NBC_01302 TaxID=2903575 RepID=UPI002E13AF37|nr:DUF6531 domain-containing protein [Kitasatospora sp. NBC_01302]
MRLSRFLDRAGGWPAPGLPVAGLLSVALVAGVVSPATADTKPAQPATPGSSSSLPTGGGKPLGPSDDVLLNGWGDASGYHLAVAKGGNGYSWREVALLKPAGIDDDSWTGYQCTSGDGDFAAVTVLPTSAANSTEARDHGAFAYSVDLRSGTVRPVAAGVALKYYSPGCGTGDLAAFTSNPGVEEQTTQVLTVDLAAGKVQHITTVGAQVTSVVPTSDGPLGVVGANLVKIPESGARTGQPQKLAQVSGSAFDLRPLADGSVGFVTVHQDDQNATVLKEHGGAVTQVGSGPRTSVQLLPGRAGKAVVVGTDKLDAKAGLVAASAKSLPLGASAASLDGGAVLGAGPQTDAATPLVVATASNTQVQPAKPTNTPAPSTVLPDTTVGGGSAAPPAAPQGGGTTQGKALSEGLLAAAPATVPAAVPADTGPNTTTPKCSVPRLAENRQVMQPSAAQVEWAVQMAEQGLLTGSQYTRPANYANLGLAAYAPNGDFPRIPLQHPAGDSWDSVPRSVYQAIVAQESNFSQASWHSVPGIPGDPLIGDYYGAGGTVTQLDYSKADCGYGLGQVTAGMSTGDGIFSAHGQMKIAVDYQENIAAGLQNLENTWNKLYSMGILVNGGDPRYLENWYLAAWAYNSGIQPDAAHGNTTNCTPSATCTGPDGTWGLGWGNNPMNPDYPPNRAPYLSTTYDDARHPGSWPYEERIMGWMGSPILRYTGTAYSPAFAKPTYHGGKSWPQIPPISQFCTADSKCDPTYVNQSNPNISYCTLADRECWWHTPTTWIPDCSTTCATSDYTWAAGSTEPAQSDPHPPTCNVDPSKVPTTSNGAPIIVAESQSYPPLNLVGCANPNWTQGGTFSYSYGTNAGGAPLGAIDTHQLGVGFGGHILFNHTVDGSDPSQVDTGTWTPNLPKLQYYKIKLHLPATGASATNVVYTINPGGGVAPWKIRVNQDWGSEQWVTIGTFAMQSGGNVQLTNKSDTYGSGNIDYSSYDVAYDAIAFIPQGGTPGQPIGGPPTVQDAPKGSNPAFIQCGCARRTAGDPVDTSTGYFGDDFTDLSTPGRGIPLNFTRSYASALADPNGPNGSLAVNGPFGWGWTDSYNLSTTTDPSTGNVTVHQEDGSQVTFVNTNGSYAPSAPRYDATLTSSGSSYTFTRQSKEIYTFDTATGHLTAETDVAGSKAAPPYATKLSYDSNGNLSTITDPAGRAYTLTWSGGHITALTDTAGRQVSYGYDGNGNLTDVYGVGTIRTPTLQDNDHAQYGYTAAHLMNSIRRPAQFGSTATPSPVVSTTYDANERVLTQTDQVGATTRFTYGPDSTTQLVAGQTLVTDPAGHKTLDTYQNGLLVTETKGYGSSAAGTWSYSYDPVSLGVIGITDPNGGLQTFTYDDHGNQTSASDPRGFTTVKAYDANDNLMSTTDPAGLQTTYTYDPTTLQLTGTTQTPTDGVTPARTSTVSHDDPAHPGDATRTTDARGNTTTTGYDAMGDVISVTDPLGNTTKNGYDTARGLLSSTVSPVGTAAGTAPGCTPPARGCTTYQYDAHGNRTSTTDPLGHTTLATYDADNNRTTSTDGNNRTTGYAYDADDRETSVTKPDHTVSHTDYNPDGTVADTVDATGAKLSYGYDGQGHRNSQTNADQQKTAYTLNTLGQVLTVTNPAGQTTTYGYNPAGQVTSISYSDGRTPAVTFGYDAGGRRTGMTDGTGSTTWSYDAFGEVLKEVNGAGASVGYGYDSNGNQTSVSYPGQTTPVAQAFDKANHLTGVTDWNNAATGFGYDADGNVTSVTYPNGDTISSTYDDTDSITGAAAAHGTTQLASLGYTRDNSGQLSGTSPTGLPDAAQSYQYSPREELSSATTGSTTTAYGYDAAGRPTSNAGTAQAFDLAGQLCWTLPGAATGSAACGTPPVGATTYTYNSQGDRTAATPITGTATSYTYNQADELTGYSGPGGTATYGYNGQGLRISKTVGGVSTAFTWDAAAAADLLSDGTTNYLYGPGGLAIEQINSTGSLWYFHDALGSTRALLDGTGVAVAGYAYDAFGNQTSHTGVAGTPLRFGGDYNDSESGLVYLRARYYDPSTAQFITVDPAIAATHSAYGYTDDSPVNITDRTGLCFPWCTALIGAVIGGAAGAIGGIVSGAASGHINWGDVAIDAGAGAVIGAAVGACGPCGATVAASAVTGAVSGAADGFVTSVGTQWHDNGGLGKVDWGLAGGEAAFNGIIGGVTGGLGGRISTTSPWGPAVTSVISNIPGLGVGGMFAGIDPPGLINQGCHQQ